MYARKRIFAYAIDLMLIVMAITAGLALVGPYLFERLPERSANRSFPRSAWGRRFLTLCISSIRGSGRRAVPTHSMGTRDR